MKSQSTTSDNNKVNSPRSIPDYRAVVPQSSSESTNRVLVTGHRHDRGQPLPSPARFLKKPEATAPEFINIPDPSSSGSNGNFITPIGHATSLDALSIPASDSTFASGSDLHSTGLHFREGSGNARKGKAAVRASTSDGSEEHLLSQYIYPPSRHGTFSEQATTLRSHEIHDSGDHVPISAPTVFSRYAAPLSLPQLDKYISSLSLPAFSLSSRTKANTKQERFVPLDRLAKTGRSIESLETNFQRKPAWRNFKSILSGLVNIVLGVLVSRIHSVAYS
jgi:hypothetical protein